MSTKAQGTNEKQGKNSGRGSVNNSRRLDAFASAKRDGDADWSGCDAGRLQGVIIQITRLGGAITIGLSRDMGAHSLTLLLDGQRETLWFNGGASLDDELDMVAGKLESME